MQIKKLTEKSIRRAVQEYDELGRNAFLSKYGFGGATAYVLVVDDREYDPKAIAGVAYGLDHPSEGPLSSRDFASDEAMRNALRLAGYQVHLAMSHSQAITEGLKDFMSAYVAEKESARHGKQSSAWARMAALKELFAGSGPLRERPHVEVKGSIGQGNWSWVPWIAFLDKRETDSVQRGVFPVMLFREDMSGVYLTIGQGVEGSAKGRGQVTYEERSAALQAQGMDRLLEHGFVKDSPPKLGDSQRAVGYERATFVHKFYPAGDLPSDDELLHDIEEALLVMEAYIDSKTEARPSEPIALGAAVAAFKSAVDRSGLQYPNHPVDRVTAFACALLTKPFVILTGMSGSGKTQLALRLGEWFGDDHSLVVPVRPDWTGPDALFGYEDALRPRVEGRAAWHVPPALEFLLRATRDPKPHLLVLDEMNLAHVERYFSDYLSGIESKKAVLPNLVSESDFEWRVPLGEEALVPLPGNVFVVGTVNVDETTYQFSPKVLDRACTFEVRTGTEELEADVGSPKPIPPGETEVLTAVAELVLDEKWRTAGTMRGEIGASLRELHKQLTKSGDEFGHRLYQEGLAFAAALELAGVQNQNDVLDQVMLVKVLPRLHGSRRRIEPVLEVLRRFAQDPASAASGAVESTGIDPALPRSHDKLSRMLETVRINQFVSFTD